MELELIKEKLMQLGYVAVNRKIDNSLTVGFDNGYDEALGLHLIENPFGVYIVNNEMVVDYAIGQIPKEEKFSRVSEGIKFIKKTFPVDS